ncbi:Transcription factor Adf-1 [Frankliniella fusca]|uniref:Transcription factor Adf-1 n=1 Tax=Frankliniella fusca TaxID=407009 RepID=A0AAE1HX94_9NEOP|nr:Transcription factor Adf-1 [Frankliniella fusca]
MARKNTLKFAHEEDLAFVMEVEKCPDLWDVTLEIYRRADLKAQAWEEIGKKLGPKFATQGCALWAHFKNLKDTFMQNLRKVRESTRSGVGTDSVYKPKWFLWDAMQFLKKTCAQSESTSNMPANEAVKNIENIIETENSASQPEIRILPEMYFDEALGQVVLLPPDTCPF